eukprot:TRINITY_DN6503_c0_g1_i4.p1 TRINITY_DN6503_c0_g1~~TRINITY_DN6503_c0_g1_i4.p1  ORF type:complete len:193 (+),score=36.67 TRINITY_DN6503_c0_g1_i4:51-629(+)
MLRFFSLQRSVGVCAAQRRLFFTEIAQTLTSTERISRKHTEASIVGYSPKQVYDVVSDVDQYHMFLPWCQDSKVLWRKGNHAEAKLVIGFPPVIEKYTSKLTLVENKSIQVQVLQGSLFHHLNTDWQFDQGVSGVENSCKLTFSVDFAFVSSLHNQLVQMFFKEAVLQMRDAFVKRCQAKYGRPSMPIKLLK